MDLQARDIPYCMKVTEYINNTLPLILKRLLPALIAKEFSCNGGQYIVGERAYLDCFSNTNYRNLLEKCSKPNITKVKACSNFSELHALWMDIEHKVIPDIKEYFTLDTTLKHLLRGAEDIHDIIQFTVVGMAIRLKSMIRSIEELTSPTTFVSSHVKREEGCSISGARVYDLYVTYCALINPEGAVDSFKVFKEEMEYLGIRYNENCFENCSCKPRFIPNLDNESSELQN